MDDLDKNIRKLRKKLRQIDQLTIMKRSLNDEESRKVSNLSNIRDQLQCLLKEKEALSRESDVENVSFSSGDQQLTVLESEIVTTAPQSLQEETERQEVHSVGDERSDEEHEEVLAESSNTKRKSCESADDEADVPPPEPEPQQKPKKLSAHHQQQPQGQAEKTKKQSIPWWRNRPRYFVQELVGHSDIILDVSIADGLVASASRDSQVKVWTLDSGSLECTLSGHTESVQACLMLPSADSIRLAQQLNLPVSSRLVVTGGGDSHLLLWRIDPGLRMTKELRRIYMFTPITCLVHLPDEEGLVIALGTSSGKIEIWDVLEKHLVRSRTVHESPVTCLRFASSAGSGQSNLLSCSENGEVVILRSSDLRTVYQRGDDAQRRSVRHNAALSLINDWVLIGDAGSSLKLLRRGHKTVVRLANSRQEFGVCDALWSNDAKDLVIATAYNVDDGRAFLNCHNVGQPSCPSYLISLESPQFSGRFLCLDAVPDPKGEHPEFIVTGGMELRLWQKVSPEDDFTFSECSRAPHYRLFRPRDGEESPCASGLSSDDLSGLEEDMDEEDQTVGDPSANRWWCRIL